MLIRCTLLAMLLLTPLRPAQAADVTVAVAANFLTTAQALSPAFEAATGHRAVLVGGSTGRLTAQIMQGAPYDVFLSADADHPHGLLTVGRAIAVRPYAIGRLVLVGPPDMPDQWGAALARAASGPLAIANPKLAPYGAAARAALDAAGLTPAQIITGDSVGQVAAFVASGNVGFGLLALAQVLDGLNDTTRFAFVEAPDTGVSLTQSAALIADTPAARAFFEWITGPEAAPKIAAAGYHLPKPAP